MSENLNPQTRALIEQTEAALPGQNTDEFVRIGEGLCYATVCTSLSDDAATARMNAMPSGTRGGWQISEDEEFADGLPHPCRCEQRPNTHRHLLFEA